MRITETLQRAGDYRARWKPNTPPSTIEAVETSIGWTGDVSSPGASDGWVVVTTTRIPERLVALSNSVYTGRITKVSDNEFSGVGLAALLGAEGHPSELYNGTLSRTAQNLDAWATDILANGNGITKGTITEPGGTYAADWIRTSPIEMFDVVCTNLGAEWHIDPQAVMDAGPQTNVFGTTPTVIFTGGPPSPDTTPRGLQGRINKFSVDINNRVNKVYVAGDGEGASTTVTTSTSAGTNMYGIDGTAATMAMIVDAPNEATTPATAIGDETLARYEVPRFDCEIVADERLIRTHVKPGDSVYLWDLGRQIRDSGATAIRYDGALIHPVTVRCQELEWSPTEDAGVYLYRDAGTPAFTDITDHVDLSRWEPAVLQLGSGQGRGDIAVASGQSRFNRPVYERLTR